MLYLINIFLIKTEKIGVRVRLSLEEVGHSILHRISMFIITVIRTKKITSEEKLLWVVEYSNEIVYITIFFGFWL